MERAYILTLLFTTASSAAMAFVVTEQQPTMIKLELAPTAVQAAIKLAAGTASVVEVEKELDGKVTLYEAAWNVDGLDHEIVVNKAGDVMVKESVVTGDAVPEAVRSAAAKHLPKGAEAKFESRVVMLYEIEATVDGKEIEFVVDPSGRVVEVEVDDDAEGEDRDEDHADHQEKSNEKHGGEHKERK